jgi:(E)-4-hydroxy-3-methylbut-2-enyl-diphosphate synthase
VTRQKRSSRQRSRKFALLESLDYFDFKISVKSSHVPTMIRAYRLLAEKVPYPLHLGVTEAGHDVRRLDQERGRHPARCSPKGIGDTIRVSLAADPVEEPKTAYEFSRRSGCASAGP